MKDSKKRKISPHRSPKGRRVLLGKAGLAALLAAMMLPTTAWAAMPDQDNSLSATLVQTAPDTATPESALPETTLVPETTVSPEPDPLPRNTPVPESTPAPETSLLPEAAAEAAYAVQALSGEEIPLDESHFPDPAFRNIVRAYDTDGSGGLSTAEAAAVTRMDIRSKGIQSLEGIGAFPNLTYLNCIGNALTRIPLQELPNLTQLLCNENQITSLDLAQVPELTLLHCHDNRLAVLDVSPLPHLQELACGDNPFTTLDLSHNAELAYLLYLGGPLQTLTLSHNDALVDLWCSYSLVSQLDLAQAPNLELLGVDRCDLTGLDISHNPKLTSVMAGDNKLLALRTGENAPSISLADQRPVDIALPLGETTYDLAALDLAPDAACISDLTGAELSGSVLTGLQDGSVVTYRYTQGGASFTATLQFHSGNTWLEPLTIGDWTYGETARQPHADALYGEPVYEYGASADGIFTAQTPTEAGTWFVRATVQPDDGHSSMTDVVEFHILPKPAEDSWVSAVTSARDAETLTVRDGDTLLQEGVDYTVTARQENDRVELTVTMQGNYTGEVRRSYTLAPEVTSQPETTPAPETTPVPETTSAPEKASAAAAAAPTVFPTAVPAVVPAAPQASPVSSGSAKQPDTTPAPSAATEEEPSATATPAPVPLQTGETAESAAPGTASSPKESSWLWLLLLLLVLLLTLYILRSDRDGGTDQGEQDGEHDQADNVPSDPDHK